MIPTYDQGIELISKNNTTHKWTGSGYKLTSKTYTSKYIFLPAGGYWWDANHYFTRSRCYYWCTKLDQSGANIIVLEYDDSDPYIGIAVTGELAGVPIRPVVSR